VNQETRTPEPEETPPEGTPPELPPETAVDAAPAPPRAPRPWLALLALVLALSALGAAAWVYTLARAPQADPRVAALEQRINDLNASLSSLRQGNGALQDRLGQQDRTLSRLQRSVESLRAQQRGGSTDWALAEVENLLIIATQRLTLARDVEAAIAAMGAANDRLAGLDDPGLTEVRAQIAKDLSALRGVNDVDITGLSLFLADLAQRAGTLPLRDRYLEEQEERAQAEEPPAASGWRGVLSAMWEEISDLVVVSRDEGSGVAATLLPEERYFLVHNLRLQVEVMRLAVLRRDTATLRSSAQLAADWLETYFDTDDAGVSSALEAIVRMQELELQPELPDIDSSLETLRAAMRNRAAEDAPVEPEPAS
jgi:uroporphyrin-3 C-methyltransferase